MAAVLACTVAGVVPSAQQIFRASTDMVLLSVTATRNGNPAGGLDRGEFVVFEDGRVQDIEVFARERQPVALSLLLDASVSMETKMPVASEAAVGFAQRLGPDDVAQVVTFNTDTEIRQPFTNDKQLLETAIRTTRADGSTALYTALYVAFSELDRLRRQAPDRIRRQAIILMSDGEDTTSLLPYEDVLDRAKRSDVVVYAIGLRDGRGSTASGYNNYDFALRTLAQTTGGRAFFVSTAAQLPQIYTQIADELSAQYIIGYTSNNPKRDGAWRQVAVRVNQQGVIARTRTGYYGPTKGQ
jgi:Ca-activated chloride channel family protein